MRIADRSTARNYLKYLNKAKTDFAETNNRIVTGNRFSQISDDVAAGTRVLRSRADLVKSQTYYDNVKSVGDELSVTESALTSINDILSDVYGTKIKAAMSEEKGEAGRTAIANEIKAMKDQILQISNTKYSNRYVFGGSNSSASSPFTQDKDGKLLYNGVNVDEIQKRPDGTYFYLKNGVQTAIEMDNDVFVDIGLGIKMDSSRIDPSTGFKISYSGLDVLGFGKNENGLSNNIFNILSDVENNIRSFNKTALDDSHTQLGTLADKFKSTLTDIGAKTGFLDNMETRLKDSIDSSKVKINRLMGINDEEEATHQSMNEYVLKAVLQMGSKILPVSLMDFLN